MARGAEDVSEELEEIQAVKEQQSHGLTMKESIMKLFHNLSLTQLHTVQPSLLQPLIIKSYCLPIQDPRPLSKA